MHHFTSQAYFAEHKCSTDILWKLQYLLSNQDQVKRNESLLKNPSKCWGLSVELNQSRIHM